VHPREGGGEGRREENRAVDHHPPLAPLVRRTESWPRQLGNPQRSSGRTIQADVAQMPQTFAGRQRHKGLSRIKKPLTLLRSKDHVIQIIAMASVVPEFLF
jgi:hypothetical protein